LRTALPLLPLRPNLLIPFEVFKMEAKAPLLEKAKVNDIEEIYRGGVYSFVVEDITLPNGKRTTFPTIRHPGSTGIVPLAADGTVVMTFQYRHAVGEYLLEIPAGTLERGESPLACARRELEEETGFVAQQFIEIARVHIIPAYSDEQIYVYLAKDLQRSRQHLDEDEIIRVVNYPLAELLELIRKGAITDALTVLALNQAQIYLQNPYPSG